MPCPFCQARSVIGIEHDEIYDGVLYWQCCSCSAQWHRFPKGDARRAALEAAQPDLVLQEPDDPQS